MAANHSFTFLKTFQGMDESLLSNHLIDCYHFSNHPSHE